jgi:hypothetical protein
MDRRPRIQVRSSGGEHSGEVREPILLEERNDATDRKYVRKGRRSGR